MNRVLVVDDEKGVRESLKFSLKDKYEVITSENGEDAIKIVEKKHPDLVILDIILPDKNGIEVLKEIKRRNQSIPVIILTAISQVKTAVEAMKIGAIDYITKPFDIEELTIIVRNVFKSYRLENQVSLLKEEIKNEFPIDSIVFRSEAMRRVIEESERVARTSSSVLLIGPTGAGKELIARYIHEKSKRKNEPFIPVHCAAIPETLFESEIFGYEKGAFTNAFKSKKGKIEMAGAGTIFFDEISEIPLSLQVKLLRFLQEKEFSRLGSNEIIKSDARIISATSKDLKKEIEEGNFREDLYYRISVVPLKIPSLKERREDIIPLVEYYLEFFKNRMVCKTEKFSPEALEVLFNYDWPGNVREVKNIIERILVLKGNKVIINVEDLPEEVRRNSKREDICLKKAVENFERELILKALEKTGWNQTAAAKLLGTTRRILRYKMEKFNLIRKDGGRKNSFN